MLLKWHKCTGPALRVTCSAVGHTTRVCVTTGQGAQMLLGLLVSLEVCACRLGKLSKVLHCFYF